MTNGELVININGKDEVLKITMWQWARMKELIEQKPGNLSWATTSLIFSALENSYRFKKEVCPYDINEIDLWADELTATAEGVKTLEVINDAVLESHIYGGNGKADTSKKKK